MFFIALLSAAYLMIALFALLMTYNEQQQTGHREMLFKAGGFLACMLWPVTFVVVAVAAQVPAPATRRA